MHRSAVFFWAMVLFVAGVAADAVGFIPDIIFYSLALAMVIAATFAVMRTEFIAVALLLFAFLMGVARASGGPVSLTFLDPLRMTLESMRDEFVGGISAALPEPQAAYLSGLLVGVRTDIPYEIRDAFRVTGTSHLTALSGYNVTIIAQYMGKIFRATAPAILGIILFVFATGAPSSVVRAAIMGVLVMIARRYGHRRSMGNALLFAASAMIFFDPSIVFNDVGFQLSVVATWGLIYISPHVDPYLRWLPEFLGMRESASATVAAQISTFPLIMYYFGTFSVFSPVTNVLVLIAVPYTMFFGFIAGLAGFLHHASAAIIALPAYLLLTYQLFIIELFAGF